MSDNNDEPTISINQINHALCMYAGNPSKESMKAYQVNPIVRSITDKLIMTGKEHCKLCRGELYGLEEY